MRMNRFAEFISVTHTRLGRNFKEPQTQATPTLPYRKAPAGVFVAVTKLFIEQFHIHFYLKHHRNSFLDESMKKFDVLHFLRI